MKRTLFILAALVGGWALIAQDATSEPSLFSQIGDISRDLETITGLKFKHRVPSAEIDKDQLRKFLSTRIDKVMKPSDQRAEELTLKMLGLVPRDFDLRQQTVDLLTEQAAAFYDYQKKKLFVVNSERGEAGMMELAHELSHALADQSFHLDKYIKQDSDSDDAATARMAVMEGQATWLMSAYLHYHSGGSPEAPKFVLDVMSRTVEQSASQYPVFSQEPLYIRQSLVFPYKAGMLFQDAVYRKLGKQGFAEVFERAPVSTQQVMHPEKYIEKEAPRMPQSPRAPDEKHLRKLAVGTLGEFDFNILLTQYTSAEKADGIAPHLAGGAFTLYEQKTGRDPVLLFATTWDSKEAAARFAAAYRVVLQRKSKTFDTSYDTDTEVDGRIDTGFFRMRVAGALVECIEGWKTSLH
jgi:hypothetical protein